MTSAVDAVGPWLLLDTAAPMAVVAIAHDNAVVAEERLQETRRHAERLVDAIDKVLLLSGLTTWDLRGVAVGRGPGSFIGVRTGIATAKGLAYGLSIPLVGVSTLHALAAGLDPSSRGMALAVLDAKRGEVYAQRVALGDEPVLVGDPWAAAPAAIVDVIAAEGIVHVVGSGLSDLPASPSRTDVPGPSASGLWRALLAVLPGQDTPHAGHRDDILALVPEYARLPDAKLPAVDPAARRPLQ